MKILAKNEILTGWGAAEEENKKFSYLGLTTRVLSLPSPTDSE